MDLKAKPPILVWSAIDASPESPLRDSDEHTLTMEERRYRRAISTAASG